ncbi:MAG: ChaN family lipoprotein [Bacteroidetes bacterium]|nr:ChaN family lipoprotein [Bacteroidota bacterium]
MKKLILLCLLCPVLMQAQALSESNYRIYSVKQGKEVALNAVVEDMNNYDLLFFGEEHNDSVTHFLEAKMLHLLYDKFGDKTTLSMEMFERDVQTVMDEYLSDNIREKHFTRDARVWSNYRDYKPMVEFAKEKKLHVICANAAARYSNLAGRKGQAALEVLPKESKKNFAPLPYKIAEGDYYNKLMEMSGHTVSKSDSAKAKAPAMPMGGFDLIMAQSLWDATMAYSICSYYKKHKDHKILQVNGRFHSDEGFAVAAQLKNYNKRIKHLIISTASDDNFPNIKWDDYKKNGDYIIITDPKVPRTYTE